MKLFFVVFASALALAAAPQAQEQKSDTAKSSAKAAAPKVTDGSKPMPIPADAVKDDDGDYHYTDPQGKKWIYRRTPFGVVRFEDGPERAAVKAAAANGAFIKATEDGDVVHFERKGPFGLWKWDKKKSELDESEKAALRNSQTNAQAGEKTASKQDQ